SFLLGALSTGTVILTHRSSHAAGLETWRSYNTGRFEQVRDSLSSSNQRWIDVDLRRMKVTALLGSQILIHQNQQLSFQCDDGDVYNPTITGHFSPDSSAESVSMSGRKQLSTGYKEYKDIVTHYVIFFAEGYALHGLDASYQTSGSHVSAGCIRLNYPNAQALYRIHQANPFTSIVVGFSDPNRSWSWYAMG
ncbi:MAG: L,D-transpeptidase, partial [Prochlorotrichaceae cyanobacterium]